MILITVGTEKFPFDRLMKWVSQLIAQNLIQPTLEEVIIQYGSCTMVPQQADNYKLLPAGQFMNLVKQADVIIAHCGEGTIDLLTNLNKPFILVPRSGKHLEHVDDHQIELAEQLEQLGIAIANSYNDLADFLRSPQLTDRDMAKLSPSKYYAQASLLLEKQFETEEVLADLTEDLLNGVAFA